MPFTHAHPKAPEVQAKLNNQEQGDTFEQETDQIGSEVSFMTPSNPPPPPMQLKCQDCEEEEAIQMQPLAPGEMLVSKNQQEEVIQRKESDLVPDFLVDSWAAAVETVGGFTWDGVFYTIETILDNERVSNYVKEHPDLSKYQGLLAIIQQSEGGLKFLFEFINNPEPVLENAKAFLEPYVLSAQDIANQKAEELIAQAGAGQNHLQKVWEHLGKMVSDIHSNWWDVMLQVLKEQILIFDFSPEIKMVEDIWKKFQKGDVDSFDLVVEMLNVLLSVFDRFFGIIMLALMIGGFLAAGFVGATVAGAGGGAVTAGAGAAPAAAGGGAAGGGTGGTAGAGVAEVVGIVMVSAAIQVEIIKILKSVHDLAFSEESETSQREEDYNQIAASIFGLALMIGLIFLGGIATRFARSMVRKLRKALPAGGDILPDQSALMKIARDKGLSPEQIVAELELLPDLQWKKSSDPNYDFEVLIPNSEHKWMISGNKMCRHSPVDCFEADAITGSNPAVRDRMEREAVVDMDDPDTDEMDLDFLDEEHHDDYLVEDPDRRQEWSEQDVKESEQAARDAKRDVSSDPDLGRRGEDHGRTSHLFDPLREKRLRTEYMGSTPGKFSGPGKEVIRRMAGNGQIRLSGGAPITSRAGIDPVLSDKTRRVDLEVKTVAPSGNVEWVSITDCDMGHIKPAIQWWSEGGNLHGRKSPEARKFMTDETNYELEHKTVNRAKGNSEFETYGSYDQYPPGG